MVMSGLPTCIFCGGRPIRREHVIPKWLASLLVPGGREQPMYVATAWVTPGNSPQSDRKSPVPELRILSRRVCGTCNGGWMSGLENQVKPILWPLVEARPTTGLLQPLRRPDCVLRARWAAKTAVTFHYARRKVEMQELSSAMLSWLPAHDDPPRNTVVWAGRYIGSRLVVVNEVFAKLEAETVSGLPLVGGLSGTALVTTMAIGKIAFQVFAFKGRGMGTVATPPAWSRSLVKLWPYDGQSLTWPPREALDDTGLEGLNARFGSALALGGMPQPKIPS
jgi:hypothetical protein